MKQYDLIVIGGGPGGYVAAIRAAQRGLSTAIIEKESIGGVCLNWGCIPTKTLLKSAKVYTQTLHASSFGVLLDKDSVKPDMPTMIRRKNGVVRKLTSGVKYLLEKNGVEIILGTATAVDGQTILVNGEQLMAKSFIVATGASVFLPPIPGMKEAMLSGYAVTAKELLDVQEIPKHLVVIGGGVIGFEFATVYNALGAAVTVVEMLPNVLMGVDDDVKQTFVAKLKKDGVVIRTSSAVTAIGEGVTIKKDGVEETMACDKVLIATGMRPNVKGLESLGFALNQFGIETNEFMQTKNPNVYAIGDVTGQFMLAHVASKEGLVAIDHLTNQAHPMDYTRIPSGVYTFPEIGMIGITEQQAKEQKLDYKTFSFPLSANGKALGEQERDGFVKLISDANNKIIGVHILSPIATELITQSSIGMHFDMTANDLVQAIHPHPTLSEMMHEAAHGLVEFPIHI
jgi:dihydrolipoamide dehydrogenase